MSAGWSRWVVVAGIAVLASACAETRYTGYDEAEPAANPFGRTVEYQVARNLYQDPPDCAAVLPFEAKGDAARRALAVEQAVARHLSLRVGRVIGPRERDRWVRSLAVDLNRPEGRRAFADGARCSHFVRVRPWGEGGMFAFVWSRSAVGLEITMTRATDDALAWRARHVATRSEGGLPLSPFSAAYNLLSVSQFESDGDVPLSLVDDAVRRMAETLPDTRMPGLAGGFDSPERPVSRSTKGVSTPTDRATMGDMADSQPYWR